ncbi:PAS domain S-box protein [Granulicella sp. L46]|uniref:PAS domain-containing sensor histidine kinase n=1 Tax=Granulicella sp. L46 TaxID=1641865 RepID=UPI001C2081EE|nr:PAS domain S-box protein [Granulicella sp. L46]
MLNASSPRKFGRRFYSWVAVGAFLAVQAVLSLTLRQGPALVAYCDISYLVLLLLASGVAIRNAVQSRQSTRLFWSFLAAAFGVWAVVPGGWFNRVVLHGRISSFLFANPPLFLHIVLMIAAMATRPHLKLPSRRPYRSTLNFLIMLFVWVFAYTFYLFPYQYGNEPTVMMLRFEAIYFVENAVLLAILGRLIFWSQFPWKRIYLHMLGASALYTCASLVTNVLSALKDPSGDLTGANYPSVSGFVGMMFTASIFWFFWIGLEGSKLKSELNHAVVLDTANPTYSSVLAMLAVLSVPAVGVWELFRTGEPIGTHEIRLLMVMVAGFILAVGAAAENHLANREFTSDVAAAHDRLLLAMRSGKSMGWDWDLANGQSTWFGDLEPTFGIRGDPYLAREGEFMERLHPDDRERVSKIIVEAIEVRSEYKAEYRVVRTDGAIRWLSDSGKFYFPANGDRPRALGIGVDITERKQAEFALRESEERFRLMSNTTPVLIWMADTDKLYTYFNKTWLDFTGRPLSAELGNGWADGIHVDDLLQCLETYTEAFDRREPFRMEYRLRASDGEYHWLLDIGVPRFNSDNSFAGYIGSCIDVTERRLAEEALSSISGRLIEAQEQERTRIARELHDDFSQRMALLAIELDLLKKDLPTLNGDALHRVDRLREQAREMGSDIQALSHELHSAALDHLGIVVAMRGFCHEFGEKQKFKIEFHCGDLPNPVSPDVALCLYRVLQEALHNAAKHSRASQVNVDLLEMPGEIRLTVSDDGVGFDVESVNKGRGLGLISIRERAKLMNGTFSIVSKLNCGTEIDIHIPVRATPQVD